MEFFKTDIQYVRGIGPALAAKLADLLGGRRTLDFLFHIPRDLKFRPNVKNISDGVVGEIITLPLKITGFKPGGKIRGRQIPARFSATDESGAELTIQFFGGGFTDYWAKQLPVGQWRIVSGKLEGANKKTISHPDFIADINNPEKIPTFQAIYPLTEGLTQKIMQTLRDQITPKIPSVPEWQSATTLTAFDNISFANALRAAHNPKTFDDVQPTSKHIARLAFDELFAHQLAIALTRKTSDAQPGISLSSPPAEGCPQGGVVFTEKLLSLLPFTLTDAQQRTIDEIFADMARPTQMRRLVQGDVGSGKTIVSLFAMLRASECGYQSAMLAPTDSLANQHFAKIKPLCDALGIHCDILTGRDTGSARHEKLISLKSGRTKILIGTHALFQNRVEYKNLGLAVIDEQHRFGVNQRLQLTDKGAATDMLALSATPIPRTLSMTIYGDMDISIIDAKPAGRKPIKTSKLGADKIPALAARLAPQIENGAQVFWVCPLVKDSESSDLMSAENRFLSLRKIFGENVGLAHGKMPKEQQGRAMADFAAGKIKILVATTIIEVGIDVPQASIMVIEDAWRFGLSALHQLRGRVGRGQEQSFCILLAGRGMTEEGANRLEIMCQTDDGFQIAEHDLIMRGVGELLGVKQSGFTNYKFVNWGAHKNLFRIAARAAKELVDADSTLSTARGAAARLLLQLFDRDSAMEFVKAG